MSNRPENPYQLKLRRRRRHKSFVNSALFLWLARAWGEQE